MPTANVDYIVHYLQYFFVDGKFYTIFSVLFGIGFSIIISHAEKRGADGFLIFYRRMFILVIIGFLHLMFLWSGDILMLYAMLGMLLPLFRNMSNKGLLSWALFFMFLPVVVDTTVEITGAQPAAYFVEQQWYYCDKYGITEDNFAYWLRDSNSYTEVFQFLIQGALVRAQEFIDGNRYFKVMGLFLIGFYIGRNKMYADLESRRKQLMQTVRIGFAIGIPLTLVYAWSCMNGHPLGLGIHSLLYFASVFPLGFAYIAGVCLLHLKYPHFWLFRLFTAPGRMALTNYIGQSAWGMFLFYGIFLGFGASVGLVYVVLISIGVYLVEALFSHIWLRYFNFGPLEWIWRMLTYGKVFKLSIQDSHRHTSAQ